MLSNGSVPCMNTVFVYKIRLFVRDNNARSHADSSSKEGHSKSMHHGDKCIDHLCCDLETIVVSSLLFHAVC